MSVKVWHVLALVALIYWIVPKRWARMTCLAAVIVLLTSF